MERFLATVAAVAVFGGAAFAETYTVDGTGMGSDSNEVMPINDDLIVIKAASNYTGFETSNPDNPLATLKGPCFGSMVIEKGKVSGGGNCHYTDADGDVAIMTWTAEGMGADGKTMGSWRVSGGTGKWTEATGGGSFNAGTDASGTYSNQVTGELTMP